MKITVWSELNRQQQQQLLLRPAMESANDITAVVTNILQQVKEQGDDALKRFAKQFDRTELSTLQLSEHAIVDASQHVVLPLKEAMQRAAQNIETFHQAQKVAPITVETQPGITCQQITRPIKSVGLYIPGGSAPLLSTVLMLAIPAKIAGCSEIILCSPPPIANEIIYAAQLCGVKTIYQVGGAQAIAAMAFGTQLIPKVDKIFGPGNAYVTEAKRQVSQNINGAAIDMPAGPSEVLVIADDKANPAFIAADLLSQAEHGPDSQVILLTPSQTLAQNVLQEVDKQLNRLSRADIARQALAKSQIIVTADLDDAVEISNQYGPEHLIIQTRNANELVNDIISAGSVFLGDWSPESVGDYASGTNHVLPTYGYTATYSSLGLADFQKRMTVQQLTPQGLLNIATTVELMAEAEQLTAHKNAVTLRVNVLKEAQ